MAPQSSQFYVPVFQSPKAPALRFVDPQMRHIFGFSSPHSATHLVFRSPKSAKCLVVRLPTAPNLWCFDPQTRHTYGCVDHQTRHTYGCSTPSPQQKKPNLWFFDAHKHQTFGFRPQRRQTFVFVRPRTLGCAELFVFRSFWGHLYCLTVPTTSAVFGMSPK